MKTATVADLRKPITSRPACGPTRSCTPWLLLKAPPPSHPSSFGLGTTSIGSDQVRPSSVLLTIEKPPPCGIHVLPVFYS
jgi:hypothetical protein